MLLRWRWRVFRTACTSLVGIQQGADPATFAASLAPDSWLAHRIQHFGESSCAFVLTGAATFRAERPSVLSGPRYGPGGRFSWFGPTSLAGGSARAGFRDTNDKVTSLVSQRSGPNHPVKP